MQTNRGIIGFIILVFIAIMVGLLAVGFFTEQRPFGFGNFRTILKLECGLNIYDLGADDTITFPHKLYGYANGCDWEPVGDVLGNVTVLNSNGLIMGTFRLRAQNVQNGKPYYFETTLTTSAAYLGEQGTIVIENALPGLQHTYKTIPVHFKSNL